MILGSGALTHNLRELRRDSINTEAPTWVSQFNEWLREKLESNDVESLLDYRNRAPGAVRNHPTDEHLLPLFVALGAACGPATRLHAAYEYGALSMDFYRFE